MYYTPQDVMQFLANKQFIDTAVIPLVSISFDEQKSKHISSAADFLMALTNFIEQQFKGRLMVTPPFTYFDEKYEMLNVDLIHDQLQLAGFKHIFFITCDNLWLNCNNSNEVIWLPAIPLESMDKGVKQRILEDQLSHIIPRFTSSWVKQ